MACRRREESEKGLLEGKKMASWEFLQCKSFLDQTSDRSEEIRGSDKHDIFYRDHERETSWVRCQGRVRGVLDIWTH